MSNGHHVFWCHSILSSIDGQYVNSIKFDWCLICHHESHTTTHKSLHVLGGVTRFLHHYGSDSHFTWSGNWTLMHQMAFCCLILANVYCHVLWDLLCKGRMSSWSKCCKIHVSFNRKIRGRWGHNCAHVTIATDGVSWYVHIHDKFTNIRITIRTKINFFRFQIWSHYGKPGHAWRPKCVGK